MDVTFTPLCILSELKKIFFLEHAGELCIFILRDNFLNQLYNGLFV